ncbi:phosphotransferase [Actinoplanes sp. LDG1-06]|uniref:Phosphotransferase n=1 Tax=Paractinoplanes ovalisporus TaxID=2810368 RepID=A0ABS2AKR2_9ACTN|nr:phosphotransferase [Actinoplanes ovalisporus]MBM2620375.1 phosphotransferase [Actinoplanes ovalisporus]
MIDSLAEAPQRDHAESIADELSALHRDLDGAGRDRLSFDAWVPRSARKQRQRLFVRSSVDGVPRLVAKVPLDLEDTMVDREWDVLSAPAGVGVPSPQPVARLRRGFAMTYVPSRDFPQAMSEAPAHEWPALLGAAVDLAAVLHTSDGDASRESAAEVAARYLPGLAGIGPNTLRYLDGAAVGPAHGDLGPWNLRVDGDGGLAIIDWEDYRPVGLPALDALNIVLTAGLVAFPDYVDRGFDWLYDRVFHEDNPFRTAADHALRRYAERTGSQVHDLLQLTPLFCRWMIRRIEDQGRPAGHLFFGPFAARFEAENGDGR